MRVEQDGFVYWLWDIEYDVRKEAYLGRNVDNRKLAISRHIGGTLGHRRTGIYSLKI